MLLSQWSHVVWKHKILAANNIAASTVNDIAAVSGITVVIAAVYNNAAVNITAVINYYCE